MAALCDTAIFSGLDDLYSYRGNIRLNAFDFIIHNFDYDEAREEIDTALLKLSMQCLQEEMK